MNNRSRTFALLISVGNYDNIGLEELPAVPDLYLMQNTLVKGLKIDPDNIRILGKEKSVPSHSFARSLTEFEKLLNTEDCFIFYFSGHGRENELLFSDGAVTLNSIIEYISRLQARQKIVILDCCYAGQAEISIKAPFMTEESLAIYSGAGVAVMASCASGQDSWTADDKKTSLYTKVLSTAICSRRRIRKGRLSLQDINEEIRYLMGKWNEKHPERAQYPVYRDNMIGTVFFQTHEYLPYIPQKIYYDTAEYTLHHVKPMNTAFQKRLSAFVILKSNDESMIVPVAKQIVKQLQYSDVFASIRSETRFKGKPVDVIWCYFGHDEEDLLRSNHFAYTIWAKDEKLRETYYRENSYTEVLDDIYVFWNPSYETVKKLQETNRDKEDIKAEYTTLQNLLIEKAESFIHDLAEVENGTISWKTVKAASNEWIHEVKELFFKLSDSDIVPPELNDLGEAILDLGGYVVDLALYMDHDEMWNDNDRWWIIKETVRRYREKLEELSEM